MSEQLAFSGAVLLSFSRNHKGGSASFSSTLTTPVSKAMGWGDIPDFASSIALEGDLHATILTITPKDGPLSKYSTELDITRVMGFELVKLETTGKRGKGHRLELYFKVKFSDATGCAHLEEFMTSVGDGKASLIVRYERQAKQADLIPDDVRANDEQRQGALDVN